MNISRVDKERNCIEVVILFDQADMHQNSKIMQSAVWDWQSKNYSVKIEGSHFGSLVISGIYFCPVMTEHRTVVVF